MKRAMPKFCGWMGKENKYVEEVGSMNMFFKIDGEVITPPLAGSILPGITRDSIIQLCKDMGVPVTERKLSMEEIYEASQNGKLEEAFGTGTAAVVSPVGSLTWEDKEIIVNGGGMGGADTEAVRYADGNSVWPYRRSSWMGT